MRPKHFDEKLFLALRARFGVSHAQLVGRNRNKQWCLARHVGMYLSRENGDSYDTAAWLFGRADHTTAIHAYNKIAAGIALDSRLAEDVEWCRQAVGMRWVEHEPWQTLLKQWREDLPYLIKGLDPHWQAYHAAHQEGWL